MIGPPREIAAAILNHAPLGVFLTTLHIEWMTQKHYLESVKDNAKEHLDPLFCSLLKHHWIEESQHAKLDTLVVDKIASSLDQKASRRGSTTTWTSGSCSTADSRPRSGWTSKASRRRPGARFTSAEREEIERAQLKSYRWTFLLSGMTHPNFDRSLRELSGAGHQRVGELGRAIA